MVDIRCFTVLLISCLDPQFNLCAESLGTRLYCFTLYHLCIDKPGCSQNLCSSKILKLVLLFESSSFFSAYLTCQHGDLWLPNISVISMPSPFCGQFLKVYTEPHTQSERSEAPAIPVSTATMCAHRQQRLTCTTANISIEVAYGGQMECLPHI